MRCVCGFIREGASHLLLKFLLYSEQFSLMFYTTIIFEEKLELYYLETLKGTRLEIFCYQKQYRHLLRTVGNSLKEHTPPPKKTTQQHFTFRSSFTFFYIINSYTLIIRHALCQTYVCMIVEKTSYKLQNLCSILLYIFDNRICLDQ